VTSTQPQQLEKASGHARRLLAVLVGLLVSLALIVSGTGPASAQNAVGPQPQNSILTVEPHHAAGQSIVGVHALPRLQPASATGVAADTATGGGARFITNAAGDTLDTSRITIPEGKFGYLLKNPSKAGVFSDSMGFDQSSLDTALRDQLTSNFGDASDSVSMTGGGSKFTVRGPITGPSGATWNITTVWGVDPDGTVRLITATP
jgi:hypothetical protein